MKYVLGVFSLAALSQAAHAMQVNSLAFVTVPALDDVGLIALAAVVGLAGAVAVRRKKKK